MINAWERFERRGKGREKREKKEMKNSVEE